MTADHPPDVTRSGPTRHVFTGIALFFLAVGVVGWDLSDWRWGVLGIVLYAVPLTCCVSRSTAVRVWGFWFGVFLVAQTALTVLMPNPPTDYFTLPHNMRSRVDAGSTDQPGISGIQTITTDARGYRVQPSVTYGKAEGPRVFAIGGSTTECLSLDDRATWPHLLQEGLSAALGKPVEVVNTGVSGARARHHLATLHQVLDLEPAAAIFLIGANDWARQIRRRFAMVPLWVEEIRLKHTLLGLALLRPMQNLAMLLAGNSGMAAVPVDHGVGIRQWQRALERPELRHYAPKTVGRDYVDYLESISALCRSRNLNCIFVTQPTAYSLDASDAMRAAFWMTPGFKSYTLPLEEMIELVSLHNRFLADFALRHGHRLCDLASALAPTFENFYDDMHFNTNGARNVAGYLLPCVAAALDGR